MRRAMCRGALAVGFGALLVSACGDDGDQADFCRDGVTTLAALGTLDMDGGSNQFEEAVDVLESVDPPPEIRDDWNEVVDTLVVLRDAESLDPEDLADVNQRLTELEEAQVRIDQYVREECGTGAEGSGGGDPDG